MKKIFITSMLFIPFAFFAQESHEDRTISYTVELDRLKYESQELNIEKVLKVMEGVKSCDVDALNYKLYISVFEPRGEKKSIEIDDIKIVLANNKVEIVNYTQKIIIEK